MQANGIVPRLPVSLERKFLGQAPVNPALSSKRLWGQTSMSVGELIVALGPYCNHQVFVESVLLWRM